jgi:DNA-binding GntR family transcriptional regulator
VTIGDAALDEPPQRPGKASDWVVGWLRDSIIGGRLRPGEQLPLVQLANRAGVSTTPIREALSRLRDEGLVVGDSYRTFRVASLTLDDIRDYYQIHAFLSGVLAERAASLLTVEDIDRLRELDRQILEKAEEHDEAGVHRLNFEFHHLINDKGSEVLRRFVAMTTRLVSRRTYPDVQGWTDSIEDHGAILSALATKNAAVARVAMEQHMMHAGQAVVDDLKTRGWGSRSDE